MIVSASRRTDIPAFYGPWFAARLRAGRARVPNPFNPRQVREVELTPEAVTAFYFWTKNPAPFLPHLDLLDGMGHRYVFLHTLNDYPAPLEPFLPPVRDRLQTFLALSGRLSPARVIWRYDPIILSDRTDAAYHAETFERLARALSGATERVIISIVSFYAKTTRRLNRLEGFAFDREAAGRPETGELLGRLAEIAGRHGMAISACADPADHTDLGIAPGRCLDGRLLERLWGVPGPFRKDPGQRKACGCAESRDIGMPDSCLHGCPYCYSTVSHEAARRRHARHDPGGEMLVPPEDRGEDSAGPRSPARA